MFFISILYIFINLYIYIYLKGHIISLFLHTLIGILVHILQSKLFLEMEGEGEMVGGVKEGGGGGGGEGDERQKGTRGRRGVLDGHGGGMKRSSSENATNFTRDTADIEQQVTKPWKQRFSFRQPRRQHNHADTHTHSNSSSLLLY